MSIRPILLGLILSTSFAVACGGSDAVEIGTTTLGTYTLDIKYEGPAPIAGAMTNFVIKPTAGGQPDSVVAWIGSAGAPDSVKVTGDFDSGDGDYDNEQTVPATLTADDLYYFTLTTGGSAETGSIAFQGK
jgi:hypothetical protein